jgi:hypothetical protein
MKTLCALLALAICLVGVDAQVRCKWADLGTAFKGFEQGFQEDKSMTTTDCYLQVNNLEHRLESFVAAFPNWTYSDWLRPVYSLQEAAIEIVDTISAC